MGSMTFLAWCEPNFFRDKFNIQSQAFGWPWDKFMVHGVNRHEEGSLCNNGNHQVGQNGFTMPPTLHN